MPPSAGNLRRHNLEHVTTIATYLCLQISSEAYGGVPRTLVVMGLLTFFYLAFQGKGEVQQLGRSKHLQETSQDLSDGTPIEGSADGFKTIPGVL